MNVTHRFFYSLLFLVFSCSTGSGFAASFPAADSTIGPRKPHKLNRQQFLERYGTDDSSRALIRYYFPERKTAAILTIHSGGTLTLAGLLSMIVFLKGNGVEGGLGDFFLLLILLASAYGSALLLVVGATLLLLHSRKRLYRMLQTYQKGNGLPRRISRKKSFLRLLKQETLRN